MTAPIKVSMDADTLEVRTSLLNFVVRQFNVESGNVDLDRSLVDQGIVDSFGLAELIAFIQGEYRVVVFEKDMTRAEFGSINKMARFVVARRKGER